jgi:hypothetical protein
VTVPIVVVGFPKPQLVLGSYNPGSGCSPEACDLRSSEGPTRVAPKSPGGPSAIKILIPRPCYGALVVGTKTIVGSMGEEDDSTPDIEDFPIAYPHCSSQMRLFAIEWETKRREIYTFVCDLCGHTAARGVLTQ